MKAIDRSFAVPAISASCVTLLLGLAAAQDPVESPPAAPPATATVARGDLTLRVDLPGRIDSESRRKVVLDFDSFGGALEVTKVVHKSGPIAAGDPILELNTEPLDKAVEDAEIALKSAQQNFDFAQQDQGILAEANAIRLERAQDASENAQHAFEIFDRFTGQRMIRSSELRIMQSEYSLADQKEELAQLEKMYEESTLASETKEIVLERNRRQIPISEEYLEFAKDDLLITREYTFPDQKEAVEDALRFAMTELQHAQLQTKMAEARKVTEVHNAQRQLESAQKSVEDLQADRERAALTAVTDGLLTPIALVEGDQVRGGQVIAEIVDPDALVVTMMAQPGDLRVLAVGDEVEIVLPAYPEVKLTGEVIEIAAIGVAQGEGTAFPVRIALEASDPLVRVGLNCSVRATEEISGVLTLPANAVHTENGKRICYVTGPNGTPDPREVVIGASNGESVQIVHGLNEGDVVLIAKPEPQS